MTTGEQHIIALDGHDRAGKTTTCTSGYAIDCDIINPEILYQGFLVYRMGEERLR